LDLLLDMRNLGRVKHTLILHYFIVMHPAYLKDFLLKLSNILEAESNVELVKLNRLQEALDTRSDLLSDKQQQLSHYCATLRSEIVNLTNLSEMRSSAWQFNGY
jgi:hypothetical protein